MNLRNEILELEALLSKKKQLLFNERLKKIAPGPTYEIEVRHDLHEWTVTYQIETQLDYKWYVLDGDEAIKNDPVTKKFTVKFGIKNQKMFLTGAGIKYKLYRNYDKHLRILDVTYEFEEPAEMHVERIQHYMDNPIPERAALQILFYFMENKWSDESICHYLGTL